MSARPRVVLLHGVGLDRTMWEPVAELLAGDFEVTPRTCPGHGADQPAPDGVTLADLADGVCADIPDRGSHLVGSRWAPSSAQHLARSPSRTGGRPDLGQFGLPA